MTFEVDKNIFGLDVSDRTLRLAQLKRNGKKLIISSYNEISIPAGIIECGEIKKENNLIELIDKLIKTTNGGKITTKEVIAVLPETKTFIKVVEITSVTEEELPGLIKEEIKNHIPFYLE